LSIQKSEEITIVQSDIQLLDPHVSSDNRDRRSILFAIYESLVRRDAGGSFVPCLARDWSAENGATSWKFILREDVTFHNHSRLSAVDVVASLDRVCNPALGGELGTQGVYRSYLGNAVIKALSEHEVGIVLTEPMADLLDLIVDLPIVPKDAINELPGMTVGSGPYRLLEGGSHRLSMERFAEYWGSQPPVEKVYWQAEPDADQRVTKLLAGEADIASGIEFGGIRLIRDSGKAKVEEAGTGTCVIFMCNARSGPCVDRRVRQAFNYAVDVPTIIGKVKGGAAQPLNGPLTPLHLGYDSSTPFYQHDEAKAKSLLSDAGYGNGLHIVLDVPTSLPNEAPDLARQIAEHLAKVHVTAEIKEFTDRNSYAEMARRKEIDDAACFDSTPLSTYRVMREKLHSGFRGPWWQGYANPNVDALIDKAQATADFELRRQIYHRAYRIIHDDAPWIFLYTPTCFWGVGPRAHAWKPGLGGLITL
jgi:peptide/nickel transport system substrate-binding protein